MPTEKPTFDFTTDPPAGPDLRDVFAAAALARLADRPDLGARDADGGRAMCRRIAADCYLLADAMLAARTKPHA